MASMEIVVSNLIWPEQHHPQQQWNDSWKAIHHHLHLPAKHVVQSQKQPTHPFHHLLHHITTKQPIMTMIPLPKCHLHHLQNYWRFPNEWRFLFSLFFLHLTQGNIQLLATKHWPSLFGILQWQHLYSNGVNITAYTLFYLINIWEHLVRRKSTPEYTFI